MPWDQENLGLDDYLTMVDTIESRIAQAKKVASKQGG